MPDSTELDYIRTFISKVCTESTVKHVVEHGENIHKISDGTYQRILVKKGELVETYCNVYLKKFKVLLSQPSEELLMIEIGTLIDGINTLKRHAAITDYTKPDKLVNVKLVSSNEGNYNHQTDRWDIEIILDVKFATS